MYNKPYEIFYQTPPRRASQEQRPPPPVVRWIDVYKDQLSDDKGVSTLSLLRGHHRFLCKSLGFSPPGSFWPVLMRSIGINLHSPTTAEREFLDVFKATVLEIVQDQLASLDKAAKGTETELIYKEWVRFAEMGWEQSEL